MSGKGNVFSGGTQKMCDDLCRHFRHLDRKSVQADPDNASNTPADQGFKHPAKGSYITNGRKLIRGTTSISFIPQTR